jgi:TetR/AcrR family transcriptional regulator, mexJK operon transcriptional repressor
VPKATPTNDAQGDDRARARRGPGRPPTHGAQQDQCTTATIVRTARELFMQRGYAGVSVGEVAAAAGITKPTLYYHFGDKEGLYAAVISSMLEEVGAAIRAVTEQQEPVEGRLFELALGYFIHADYTMEPMLRDVAQLVSPQRSAHIREAYERECFTPIERLMADGVTRHEIRVTLDPHLLAQAFLALLEAFTSSGGHTSRTLAEHTAVARSMVALFWHGAAVDEHASRVLSS